MNTETKKEKTPLIERLFSVGAHFGFTKSRRHPTVTPYVYGNKQGTDIFDLEKTSDLIAKAKEVLHDAGKMGKTVLFVGTKEEISKIVKEQAERAEAPYVVNRWIGGMLTNFSEIKKRVNRLLDLISQGESGELERKYTKKERVLISRELQKLTFNFGGIKDMKEQPKLMVVVDPRHNAIAVEEARYLNIPVMGITSSDVNLKLITHPIVVNDALQSSVHLVLDELVTAYIDGKTKYVVPEKKERPNPRTRR